MKHPPLLHKGSLITYLAGEAGQERCLGYLIDFTGRGVYDANYGKVDVTKEEADAHNKCLDEAMLEGLDKNCQIGQGNTFYYIKGQVQTFCGTVVDASPRLTGNSLTFHRGGMVFRGRLQQEADCFNFKRVA